MATSEMEIPDEKIQEMYEGDRGIAVLLEPILNQIFQSEMTDHLEAESGERTESRSVYRNGTHERNLTTRVGTLELEVFRDRDGSFSGRAVPALSAVGKGPGDDPDAVWPTKGYPHAG